jgi:hypothetical protein
VATRTFRCEALVRDVGYSDKWHPVVPGKLGKFNERASLLRFIGCECGHLGRSADLVASLLVD